MGDIKQGNLGSRLCLNMNRLPQQPLRVYGQVSMQRKLQNSNSSFLNWFIFTDPKPKSTLKKKNSSSLDIVAESASDDKSKPAPVFVWEIVNPGFQNISKCLSKPDMWFSEGQKIKLLLFKRSTLLKIKCCQFLSFSNWTSGKWNGVKWIRLSVFIFDGIGLKNTKHEVHQVNII